RGTSSEYLARMMAIRRMPPFHRRLWPEPYFQSPKNVLAQNALSPRDEVETNLIRSLIASYFAIVRQAIQDLVPRAIMHLLVNHTSQQVKNRLINALDEPELFAELLHEDDAIANERARVKALLDAYKEAFKTLAEVNLTSI
ncbi:Dynamin- GTPase protein, partial [Tulasnella sp. 408]